MQTETLVPGTMTVNDTIRLYPATVAVFKRFGIDSCCGGARQLDDVAARHGLDLPALLEELETAARAGS